ncbi:hypothetical protein J7T55_010891 [Diaporthe amygdali]|uniref:uncharacterized protein n=1 Tax=Phomopsis amygdali TaxID=1214568 RepID=UPI0022FE80F3|nr:uncharacterized protein J7T55_010891 [Diaporthe amygdali]KAJ0104427.1 hypothetical protein J7T55_010891 [Diaporthe amygdali]
MATATFITAILICLTSLTVATPLLSRQTDATVSQACTELHQRKAWHQLSADEKAAYIEAELCLMNLPPKTGHPLAQNRWDEFTIAHEVQTQWIHDVGGFLPWHRYLVLAHENILRDECNYAGYQPYWEETLDMGNLASSIVFDPVTGFGGQGGQCLDDGPFANLTIHLSYNFTSLEFYADDRCVSRHFNDTSFLLGNQTNIDKCFAMDDGIAALDCYFGNPHTSGHGGVGGTMANVAASIGDPLFFLHHTNLDRLWWDWQQVDPDTRTNAIGPLRNQPTETFRTRFSLPAPGPEFLDYSGDNGGNITTLGHVVWLAGLELNVTISDVMDLGNDLNCAVYV